MFLVQSQEAKNWISLSVTTISAVTHTELEMGDKNITIVITI